MDHATRSRNFPRGTTEVDAPTCEPASAIHFSSLARSLALCHLSSGILARHFFTAWSRAGGVMGLMLVIGEGSFSRIVEATLSWLFPSNAVLPLTISYSTAPSEKISLRPSNSFPSICSGDMYWKVPTIVPSSVTGDSCFVAVNVARVPSGETGSQGQNLAP